MVEHARVDVAHAVAAAADDEALEKIYDLRRVEDSVVPVTGGENSEALQRISHEDRQAAPRHSQR